MNRAQTKKSGSKLHDFLLEIGTEELPADYLVEAQRALMIQAAQALSAESGFVWETLESWAGPRRLVLCVKNLRPEVRWEKVGPSKTAAYDPQGNLTQAAAGFCKSQGVDPAKPKLKETPKGLCLVAEHAVPTRSKLPDVAAAIVRQMRFPKQMRWPIADKDTVTFARPVRWIVALYGGDCIPAKIAGLKACHKTIGRRRAGLPSLPVSSAASYFAVIKKAGIELEQNWHLLTFPPQPQAIAPRQPAPKSEALAKELHRAASSCGGRIESGDETEELIAHNAFLAEQPCVQSGTFKEDYLTLPAEVLATSMAKHLKAFGLRRSDGKILPKFLAVLEGKPPKPAVVMGNYERILEARFKDAQFFWKEDTKTSLQQKAAQLKQVVFHKQLGTLEDKSKRLNTLLAALAEKGFIDSGLRPSIERALELSKADLVTQMVREFPTLQGVMGAEYAHHDGEPANVVQAIREQYQPKSASDSVPESDAGAWVSLLDKADTLTGFFGVGLAPTSSADPYGLRRQATGLVRILVEKKISLSLDALWEAAIKSWGSTIKSSDTQQKIAAFVLERFRWWACEHRSYPRELFDALVVASTDNLAHAAERLEQLNQMWQDPKRRVQELFAAGKVMERTGRIVASANRSDSVGEVDPGKFVVPEERALWESWQAAEPEISSSIQNKSYQNAVKIYGTLSSTVSSFFEKVFVMDPDVSIKQNRLALMYKIYRPLASHVADLSKLSLPKDIG